MLLLTLIKGIVVGIVIALPVGPVGVLCVRRTLFEGMAFGLLSGLGAAAADAIFGVIACFGLTVVRDEILQYSNWLSAAGGLFLLYVGGRALLERRVREPEPLAGEALFGAFASSFALTLTNPITILAFAAIFAKVGFEREHVGLIEIWVMVGGVFLGSLLWWLGLSFGIAALRRFAHITQIAWVNRVAGTVLVLSGLGLLVSVVLNLAGVDL